MILIPVIPTEVCDEVVAERKMAVIATAILHYRCLYDYTVTGKISGSQSCICQPG